MRSGSVRHTDAPICYSLLAHAETHTLCSEPSFFPSILCMVLCFSFVTHLKHLFQHDILIRFYDFTNIR